MTTILLGKECSSFLELDDSVLQRAEVRFVWAETTDTFVPLAREHRPDLVVLDPHVPGLDAFAAAAQILEALGDSVTVLALGNSADAARAEAAGIAGLVTRPLTQARLVEAIKKYHPVAFRRDERAEVALKVTIVRGGVEGLAYTRDMGIDGCFLLTHEPAAAGESIALAFQLPIPGAREVRAEAEVVRVESAGIALRFTTIAAADRVELGRYLRAQRRGVA
ncbi:MAG TPA: PilZ domain-containing protein [Candidatus Polarisedimenticolaceae bacterium]|nr:PilZ domain-containing protein [Candidatus Polarisedimenticolaceae bacterium]